MKKGKIRVCYLLSTVWMRSLRWTEHGVSSELVILQLIQQQGYTACGISHWAFLHGTNLLPPSPVTKYLIDFSSEEDKSYLTWALFCAGFISPAFLIGISTGFKQAAGNPCSCFLLLPPCLTSDLWWAESDFSILILSFFSCKMKSN